MRLKSANIRNVRSIAEQVVQLTHNCCILVGINESGKSNILRAMALMSSDMPITPQDRRIPRPEDPPATESYVKFNFEFDSVDRQKLKTSISERILGDMDVTPFFQSDGTGVALNAHIQAIEGGIYFVDIIKNKRFPKYYALPDKYQLASNWVRPTDACPADYIHTPESKEGQKIKDFAVIDTLAYPGIPESYIQAADLPYVTKLFGDIVAKLITESLPKPIFWEYSEKNLLPGRITISEFKKNPDLCVPLKHMFELADYPDVEKAIDTESQHPSGFRNLLIRVSRRASDHIHKIWKECEGVDITLNQNGDDFIDAGIKERDLIYNFDQRSDGFKRFVTFLLLISARDRTQKLQNTLLLIDEPEIGLHPSGAQHLRNELLKIAEHNTVMYSTHSIFMVDRDQIGRHLIVKKMHECTEVEEVTTSNITDEEVIYNALGYSIFENLKKSNIIFEGWRDKRLFSVAIAKPPSSHKDLKQAFGEVGLVHAYGVSDISRVSAVLEMANRKCVIVSDDDAAAREEQKQYKQKRYYGKWYRFSEIDTDQRAVTCEDFIKSAAFLPATATIRSRHGALKDLDDTALGDARGKIKVLKDWLKEGGINGDDQKVILEEIKNAVFGGLRINQIEDAYFGYLTKLAERVRVDTRSVE